MRTVEWAVEATEFANCNWFRCRARGMGRDHAGDVSLIAALRTPLPHRGRGRHEASGERATVHYSVGGALIARR
jgi:hypothetical protein